jgi:hypothetical protein
METFLLLDENGKIIGQCLANGIADATKHFNNKIDTIGEVLSETDYILDMQASNIPDPCYE